MRDCKRHPSHSQPGGGVCASCLQERLTWLWRGETSFRLDGDPANPAVASSQEGVDVTLLPQRRDEARNPLGAVGSLATVRTQLQVKNGVMAKPVDAGGPRNGDGATTSDVGDAAAAASKGDVIVEWVEFHARRRRRNLERGLDSTSKSTPMAKMSRSLDSLEFKPLVDRLMDVTDTARDRELIPNRVSILMSAEKIRSRSMPLDNRSAEETALRVIREQPDRLYSDELDFLEGGLQRKVVPEQRRLWQIIGKSPKWVKMLVSPMTTSRNKVFPSRVGSRKRLTRFASSDWSHTDANSETKSPHWMVSALRAKEAILSQHIRKNLDMGQQRRTAMRSSVFSWYQDADRTKIKKEEPTRQRIKSSGITDSWLRDLSTVGHLHEIAEELEIVEESSVEEDHLGDISSFGKFLLSAADRQPKADHLTSRLSSAA